jgi:hypothetical protein
LASREREARGVVAHPGAAGAVAHILLNRERVPIEPAGLLPVSAEKREIPEVPQRDRLARAVVHGALQLEASPVQVFGLRPTTEVLLDHREVVRGDRGAAFVSDLLEDRKPLPERFRRLPVLAERAVDPCEVVEALTHAEPISERIEELARLLELARRTVQVAAAEEERAEVVRDRGHLLTVVDALEDGERRAVSLLGRGPVTALVVEQAEQRQRTGAAPVVARLAVQREGLPVVVFRLLGAPAPPRDGAQDLVARGERPLLARFLQRRASRLDELGRLIDIAQADQDPGQLHLPGREEGRLAHPLSDFEALAEEPGRAGEVAIPAVGLARRAQNIGECADFEGITLRHYWSFAAAGADGNIYWRGVPRLA